MQTGRFPGQHGPDGIESDALTVGYREAEGIVDPPEIPSDPETPPEGKKAVVVRLGAAPERAPFVINKIHTDGKT